MGLEVLMYYRIGLHSIYSAFKQINIVRLMKVNAVISTYANRGRGSLLHLSRGYYVLGGEW